MTFNYVYVTNVIKKTIKEKQMLIWIDTLHLRTKRKKSFKVKQ